MDTPSIRTEDLTPKSRRAERALALYEARGHEITCTGRNTYLVPSCDGIPGHVYLVRYGGELETCDCPDAAYHPERACKHLLAVGIRHASRRSGVKVRTISVAGDPFSYAAARRSRRRGCSRCFGGYVTIGVEEDGNERFEAMPCRRCSPSPSDDGEDL